MYGIEEEVIIEEAREEERLLTQRLEAIALLFLACPYTKIRHVL